MVFDIVLLMKLEKGMLDSIWIWPRLERFFIAHIRIYCLQMYVTGKY